MKKPPLFVLLVAFLALVAVVFAGPVSAAPPPHPDHPTHPVHPPHPGTNPTVGTSSAAVAVTCIVGSSVVFPTTAHVSITSPSDASPNAPYDASFLVSLDNLTAPFDVESFAMTSTYNIDGPASPNGALVFTEDPQALSTGQSPTSTTFTQTFTPGSNGTISYRFDAVSYDFAFGGTGNIHADCTLDNGPVVVRETTI